MPAIVLKVGIGWVAAIALALAPLVARADGLLGGRTIVVDPGHGGADSGALAPGRVEKDITLAIAGDLSTLLRGEHARVVMTRPDDRTVGLAERTVIAALANPDAFVSIHANAFRDPAVNGVRTYYGGARGYVTGVTRPLELVAASERLAMAIERGVLRRTDETDLGIEAADYYVLGNVPAPSVVVETGFITNPVEGAALSTPQRQQAIAAGIAEGLGDYFRLAEGAPPPPTRDVALPTSAYLVQSGDTLGGLAIRFGTTIATLRAANGLPDDRLIAGQHLRIPADVGTVAAAALGDRRAGARPVGTYTVQAGDTVSALALRWGVDVATLAMANGLTDIDHLVAGQTLSIPSFTRVAGAAGGPRAGEASSGFYVVRTGDTLSALAIRLGRSEAALAAANNLGDRDRLVAGRRLRVP